MSFLSTELVYRTWVIKDHSKEDDKASKKNKAKDIVWEIFEGNGVV